MLPLLTRSLLTDCYAKPTELPRARNAFRTSANFSNQRMVTCECNSKCSYCIFARRLFLAEPVGREFILGLVAVLLGIAIATDILSPWLLH